MNQLPTDPITTAPEIAAQVRLPYYGPEAQEVRLVDYFAVIRKRLGLITMMCWRQPWYAR